MLHTAHARRHLVWEQNALPLLTVQFLRRDLCKHVCAVDLDESSKGGKELNWRLGSSATTYNLTNPLQI